MNLDLHVHTRLFSACSLVTPEQILERVRESVLDGVVFTEHNQFWPEDELERYRHRYPDVTIFNGAEIDVPSLHHVLTIVPEPASSLIRPETAESFIDEVEEREGIAIAAHPFRFHADYDQRNRETPLHGVEIASSNMASQGDIDSARELASQWGAFETVNSDAHSLPPIGKFYNKFDGHLANERELIDALHNREFEPVEVKKDD